MLPLIKVKAQTIFKDIRSISHNSILKNPSVLKDTLDDLKNLMDVALEDTTTIEQVLLCNI